MDWTPQDYAQPDTGIGAWDIAGIAAKKVGGRVLNGVVERHLGMDDVDVAGAVGMAGGALFPVFRDAYSAQHGEPWYSTWGRRLKWTAAIVGTTAAVGGVAYLGWKYLGKKEEVLDDEE
jgi:hypothetical protein